MAIESIESYLESMALYQYRGMLRDTVNARSHAAYDAGDAARDGLTDLALFEARRSRLREAFLAALGGLPPMDTPLNAVVTGVARGSGYRVEKVIFESRPKAYVTANLYVPDGISGKTGAVLFLCGHFEHAKHAPEYHAVCLRLAEAGLVVLAQDPPGQGERFGYYEPSLGDTAVPWGVVEHTYAGHQCLMAGDSIARYFLHDAMRGIDYLMSRPEVDPARIGVTGNSGGGTQTSLVMVCDPRIAAAAPTTFIMSRRAYQRTDQPQDLEQVWPGMTALGFDHEDILLSMAPKPVLVNAVAYDFFPVEGTRATVARARRFWSLYGREGNLELAVDLSDHHYTQTLAAGSARFFARHLLGCEVGVRAGAFEPLPQSALLCTKSGQVRGEYPDARFVFEETGGRLSTIGKGMLALSDEERRRAALSWLREKVLGGREAVDANPRYAESRVYFGLEVRCCAWRTQEGLMNLGLMLRGAEFYGRELPVTVALWDGGTSALPQRMGWVYARCRAGQAVLVVDLSGDGAFTPHDKGDMMKAGDAFGPIYKLGCDLMWLGDSIAALRTYETLRALEVAAAWPGASAQGMRLYASGHCGLYARCALLLSGGGAALESDGCHSVMEMAGSRHYDARDAVSAYLPGMLRHFDLPDLDRWMKSEEEPQ